MQHTYLMRGLRGAALAGLLAGTAATAQGQALNYAAANAQSVAGTYTDLGTTGTAIATPDFDDSNSAAQAIGFTLSFGGATYTQFVLNTNGYLKLGATAPVAPYFSDGSQALTGGPLNSADTNLLLPFNTDLEAGSSPTEYRVATTGAVGSRITTIQWKNVSDKSRTPSASNQTLLPKQYANLSFQVRLYEGSNAVEFVYGTATPSANATAASFASVGLKGNGAATNQYTTLVKASNTLWASPIIQDGNYDPSGNGFNFRNAPTTGGTAASVLPDAGRTYHFSASVANDAAVTLLYNIEQLPFGQAYAYSALVTNTGTTALTNLVVTLSVGSATATQTVASLVSGGQTTVTFPSVTPPSLGSNAVTVTVPADGNNANNSQAAATVTGSGSAAAPATFSYIKPGTPASNSFGFTYTAGAAAFTSAFCSAYTTNNNIFNVSLVRAQMSNDAASVGQKVYGVVADLNGNVLGQSAEYTIQTADLGTLHTFTLAMPVLFKQATTFLAGLAQEVVNAQYFPLGVQTEAPPRANTYYSIGITTPGPPFDITTGNTVLNIRYMVEAAGYNVVLATNSPALTRAVDVYPNPSANGHFALAVAGATAPAGLALTVVDQLGRQVYAGHAPDNATTALDLSGLAPGLYHLQVRNGDATTSRQLSILP